MDPTILAWAPAGGSANAEVGAAAATVARRARDAVRNGPYAARIVALWTGNAAGAASPLAGRRRSPAPGSVGRRARPAMPRGGSISTACRCWSCGRWWRAVSASSASSPPSPANPIGLRLQVLEADHLDTARNGTISGASTIQGIALCPAGEPIGYWLFPVHSGAWMLPRAGMASERDPRADAGAAEVPARVPHTSRAPARHAPPSAAVPLVAALPCSSTAHDWCCRGPCAAARPGRGP
jgi:hypothetical protein